MEIKVIRLYDVNVKHLNRMVILSEDIYALLKSTVPKSYVTEMETLIFADRNSIKTYFFDYYTFLPIRDAHYPENTRKILFLYKAIADIIYNKIQQDTKITEFTMKQVNAINKQYRKLYALKYGEFPRKITV